MRRLGLLAILTTVVASILAAPASAAPLYDVKAIWGDTNLPPGGEGQFTVQIRNVGDEDGKGDITVLAELPEGVIATHVAWPFGINFELNDEYDLCDGLGTDTVECKFTDFLVSDFRGPGLGLAKAPSTKSSNGLGIGGFGGSQPSGYLPTLFIDVAIDPVASGVGTNSVTVSGGGSAQPATDVDQVSFNPNPASFGLVSGSFAADLFDSAYPFGSLERKAGAHPFEQRANFDLNARGPQIGSDGTPFVVSRGTPKTVEVTLPRGFIGNPEATPKCDPVDFSRAGSTVVSTGCPPNTQVGYLNLAMTSSDRRYGIFNFAIANEVISHVPIYNLEPPRGQVADFGFNAAGFVQAHIYPTPDPAQNYAIKTVTPNISSLVSVRGSEVVVWGVPGDPAHDRFRYYATEQENGDVAGAPFGGAGIRPLLTTPMDCGFDNGGARFRADSYSDPGSFTPIEEASDPLNVEGCDDPRFQFDPDISLQPTSRGAGGPTGLDVHLEARQRNDEVADAKELYAANGFVKGIATPPIKKVVVTLPEGMTVSPSAAQGLESCSAAQIGLGTDSSVRCPDASQYGELIIRTPILPSDAQPEGHIYVAKQGDNPFDNFLALYLVIQEPDRGILIKVPGRVDLDPRSGQITTTFDDLPQFPVSDMQMSLKGGIRAALVNPSTCGTKTIAAEFFSWHDPGTPHLVNSSYEVTQKADGTPCVSDLAERPFGPSFEAGTLSNAGGAYSPFVLRLTRSDDDQELSQLGVTLAEGLTGKLAGVGRCSEAGIAQAISRDGAGQGSQELGDPSCPASSLIGATDVGAGVGVPLTYVPGRVFLAGPYRGMPLSVVVITPAVVGPFDLGVIAVRTGLRVDPVTARVTATSDPFPQIFQGIPVRIRDIRLNLDRDRFILNPTSCAEKQISAHVTGTGGDVFSSADDTAADLVERFQAADCASLPFRPRLSFRLFGKTARGGHPRFRAVVRGRPGDANIGAASVALPRSEFLDQGHIKTVCTRVQFAAKQCPPGSIYGHVTARTPLFDEAFSGPVYLRSSSNPLPDLVALLRGPASLPIEVEVAGRVDSVNGGIRNTFDVVPDAPVTSFVLTMQGGKKGLLVNSTDLCGDTHRAVARFRGQNGKRVTLRPELKASCGKQSRKRPGKH